jgi:hypothetical protein
MRVSEDRYIRDLRRINLAQRLIHHEARTRSICAWTGLSDERVRNLYRSYGAGATPVQRHRGPSPSRLATFLRSPTLRSEASAIAGVAYVLGVIPPRPVPNARKTLPGVELGERLCHAFEIFRRVVPESHLSIDQFILLALSLALGDELEVGHCDHCHAALLLDPLSASPRRGPSCRKTSLNSTTWALADVVGPKLDQDGVAETDASDAQPAEGYQRPLF